MFDKTFLEAFGLVLLVTLLLGLRHVFCFAQPCGECWYAEPGCEKGCKPLAGHLRYRLFIAGWRQRLLSAKGWLRGLCRARVVFREEEVRALVSALHAKSEQAGCLTDAAIFCARVTALQQVLLIHGRPVVDLHPEEATASLSGFPAKEASAPAPGEPTEPSRGDFFGGGR